MYKMLKESEQEDFLRKVSEIAIDERKSKHVDIFLHYCPCNTILYTLHAFRRSLSLDRGSQFPLQIACECVVFEKYDTENVRLGSSSITPSSSLLLFFRSLS
jgi:hypothetical protein